MNKTLHFEEVKVLKKQQRAEVKRGVSVNVKHGIISFPKRYIVSNKLEGQYIKFYVDPSNKALGWKLSRENKEYLQNLKEYKQLKPSKTGAFTLGIRCALNQFNFSNKNIKFTLLEIQKSKDTQGVTYNGTIYYVELKKPVQLK